MNQRIPIWGHDNFYPKPDDSKEALEKKVDLNLKAAAGEIGQDITFPNRESEVTEYQSNAMAARQYLSRKEQ